MVNFDVITVIALVFFSNIFKLRYVHCFFLDIMFIAQLIDYSVNDFYIHWKTKKFM